MTTQSMCRAFIFALLGGLLTGPVSAIEISLDPISGEDSPVLEISQPFFLDVNISGLQSGGSATLLGAFDLDIVYDPDVLDFFPASPTGLAGSLGTVPVDAIGDIEGSTPGVIDVFIVSLLPDIDLAALQSDSFTLATIGVVASSAASGATTFVTVDESTVVLSDALGNQIDEPVFTPVTTIRVPEPSVLLLLGLGLGLLVLRNWRGQARVDTGSARHRFRRAFASWVVPPKLVQAPLSRS